MARTTILRGELRCFTCGRYLGDFESHPELHGKGDIHLLQPVEGQLPQQAVMTERGIRCSRCDGRAVAELQERIAA